jgi:hypothetical protein
MEPSMRDDTVFARFMRRIRAGDDQAARELVERYEPLICREVSHSDAVRIIGCDAGPAAHPGGAPRPARPA